MTFQTVVVPDHVAAYAAALFTSGALVTWGDVQNAVDAAGLGFFPCDDLAGSALAWQAKHVDRRALSIIRGWARRRKAVRK